MLHKKISEARKDLKQKQEEMAKHPVVRLIKVVLTVALLGFGLFLNSSDVLEGIKTYEASPKEEEVGTFIARTLVDKYKEKLSDSAEVIQYFVFKEKEIEDEVRQSLIQ